MTKQEVIPTVNANKEDTLNYFRNHCMVCKSSNNCCNCEIGIAIECIEKQIPKKPKGDFHSVPHHRCPTCNCAIRLYEKDNCDLFCKFCGQAIDWSDNE